MAKVRIQARSTDDEDEDILGTNPKHTKHPGAVAILRKVLRKEGLIGWYQVSDAPI